MESENLGDLVNIHLEAFDGGRRALVVFESKKKNNINGNTTKYAGVILEEKHMMQLVDGLQEVADFRKVAGGIIIQP